MEVKIEELFETALTGVDSEENSEENPAPPERGDVTDLGQIEITSDEEERMEVDGALTISQDLGGASGSGEQTVSAAVGGFFAC